MYFKACTITLLLFLCAFAESQVPFFNNTNTKGVTAIGTPYDSCASSGLILLTNSTSECLTIVNEKGNQLSTPSCPSSLQGANAIYCLSNMCFITNPSLGIIAMNTSGAIVGSPFGSSVLVSPVSLIAVQNSSSFNILALDYNGTTSTVWRFVFSGTSGSSGTSVLQRSGKLAGIYPLSLTSFATASLHGQNIARYNSQTGASIGAFGPTFTSIESVSIDYYGRIHVYDTACSCLQVVSSTTGAIIKNFTQALVPSSVSHTREAHFVVDTNGVTVFYEAFRVVSVVGTNSTCSSKGSSAVVNIEGGASPYTYGSIPFVVRATGKTATSNTFTKITPALKYSTAYKIYNDSVGYAITEANAPAYKKAQADSSYVTPYAGSQYSYCFYMVALTKFRLNPIDNFDATLFSRMEMMVNVGNGGQSFQFDFGGNFKLNYNAGDIPLNTWTKLVVDFTQGTALKYTQWSINDLSNRSPSNLTAASPVCFDDIYAYPYDSSPAPYRKFYATDYCGATVTSDNILLTDDNVLNVDVTSTPATCNSDGNDGPKGYDGVISANATGGSGNYTYSWTFSNTTQSKVTNLRTFNANKLIYVNGMATGFSEVGSAAVKNFQDTTYYRSAPYSLSFTPSSGTDSLQFNFPEPFPNDLYSALEFWMYTGEGAQTLNMYMLRGGTVQLGPAYSLARLSGYTIIPPNQWIKISFPTVLAGSNFTGVMMYVFPQKDWVQSKIWFDDFTLVSTSYVVTATDSSGCSVTNSYINVTSPDLVTTNVSTSNVKCNGGSNGGVSFSVQGGTSPYFYSWSDTSISNTSPNSTSFLPLAVSTNVTDINGCSSPTVYTYIAQPPKMVLDFTVSRIACNGAKAIITASALGGTGPYSYSWSSSINGSYNVVPKASPFKVFSEKYDNGFGEVSVPVYSVVCAGGVTAPISYDPKFTPAHEGYCSLVIPANNNEALVQAGCTSCIDTSQYSGVQMFIALENPIDIENFTIALASGTFVVTTPLVLTNYSTNLTAFEWLQIDYDFEEFSIGYVDSILIRTAQNTTGMILIDDVVLMPRSTASTFVTGIQVPTGYKSTISGAAANYTVTVTDGNGCESVHNIVLEQPTKMVIEYTVTNGDASLSVVGGVPPYSYLWDTDDNTSIARGLSSGSHSVVISDSYGCSVNKSVVVINDSSSSTTGILAGSISGAAVLILGISGFIYWHIHRKQRQNVQALLLAEEGERRAYKIDYSELTVGALIGAGTFGQVFSGEYKGTDVAVKKLKYQQMNKQQITEFTKEAAMMVGLRNPNIVLFMGVCMEPGKLCIVTELMPRGDLSEILRNKANVIPPQILFHMAHDTLKGLQFLHSSGIVHRDLKSPNLLVDRSWNIKIADFGLSCARRNTGDESNVSILWTAPEILNGSQDYSFASDVYSYGIILWELMSRQLPWEHIPPATILTRVVKEGARPHIPDDWDRTIVKLIEACWHSNPSSRPTIKETRSMLENEIIPIVGKFELGSDGSSHHSNSGIGLITHTSGHAAVPPPLPPLVLVVARVLDAVEIWEKDPRGMSKSLQGITVIMETLANKLGGYEASVQSSFIYAFAKPANAVNFCLRVQRALLEHDWPASILSLNITKEERKDNVLLYRGLRVCMGAHWCSPIFQKDINGAANYTGAAVETASNLPYFGCPGSVMIDQDMYNAIMSHEASADVDQFSISPVGQVKCGSKNLNLFKVVSKQRQILLEEVVVTPTNNEETEPWLINFKDLQLGEVIGAGSFGDVFSGTYHNKKVAVKKLSRHRITKQLYLELQTECAILRLLKHTNLLQFEGMCLQVPNVCIVSEIAEKRSLAQLLYSNAELSWQQRMAFALGAARGLTYLHMKGIIHSDLKSSNLLVANDWTIKVADFGFNRIKAVNQTLTQSGTVAWTAPEMFQESTFTEKADVYSYAIILWEIIFRTKPWTGKHSMKVITAVVNGERPSLNNMPAGTPAILKSLMIECWNHLPDNRPAFSEIISKLDDVSVTPF